MAPVEAEAVERVAGQRLAAHRLAGFGAAQLEHMLAGRSAAEIMVEADDAVDFGARQVQRSSHSEQGRIGQLAELQIGKAPCRERGCKSVSISLVAGSVKKK